MNHAPRLLWPTSQDRTTFAFNDKITFYRSMPLAPVNTSDSNYSAQFCLENYGFCRWAEGGQPESGVTNLTLLVSNADLQLCPENLSRNRFYGLNYSFSSLEYTCNGFGRLSFRLVWRSDNFVLTTPIMGENTLQTASPDLIKNCTAALNEITTASSNPEASDGRPKF